MNPASLAALAAFPEQLAAHYSAIPADCTRWNPPAWDGIPSEHLNALEQLRHVRDIEIDGYHVRGARNRDFRGSDVSREAWPATLSVNHRD